MNFDEFEQKLRSQAPREIPRAWRAQITATARARTEGVSWWRQLLWPHPAAWAGLAAMWIAAFALQTASGPEHGSESAQLKVPARQMAQAFEERKRLWVEFAQETSPQPVEIISPKAERPRSERRREATAV
jgi:hypothetical protein